MQSCTSTRMGLHPISVRGHPLCADPRAHIAGDRRCSREPTRERPRGASLVGPTRPQGYLGLHCLNSFGLRVSHVLRAHSQGAARRGEGLHRLSGSSRKVRRRGITRSSQWRIELEPSLQNKEEGAGSVKNAIVRGNAVRAIPCRGRGPRSQECARVSYIENSLQKSKGCVRPRKAPASIRSRT